MCDIGVDDQVLVEIRTGIKVCQLDITKPEIRQGVGKGKTHIPTEELHTVRMQLLFKINHGCRFCGGSGSIAKKDGVNITPCQMQIGKWFHFDGER